MHLFIVGIAMEIGIEPTVRHVDLGYIPVVLKDACGFGDRDAAERSIASLEFRGGCFPYQRRNNLCPVSTHTIGTGRGGVIEGTLDRDSRLRWLRRGGPNLASPSASRAPTGRHSVMCRHTESCYVQNASRAAAKPVLLPKSEPRAMREHLVVPPIRGREVARARRPGVRRCETVL
jgi:hypothetical protein